MKLVLASNSPRRKELLNEFGFAFEIISSNYQENALNLSPEEVVKEFAFGKAKDVFDRVNDGNTVVLGADTVVSLDGAILGKPRDKAHAKQMLKALSNKAHQVWTGYCIISPSGVVVDAVKTDVVFNDLLDTLICEYVESGKPLDKAGAYGIQDGFDLVKEYRGSYNNVVGLPVEIFEKILKNLLKKS